MKKILAMVVVAGVMVSSATAGGGLGVFGSYWDPKDMDEGKFGAGGKLSFEVVPNISVELRGSWYHYDDIDLIPAEAGLIISFPIDDRFMPYVGGGGGYYWGIITDDDIKDEVDLKGKFGFYGVGGLEIGLSDNVALFGEAMYRFGKFKLEAKDDAYGYTGEADVKVDGFAGNVGLKLKW